MKTPEFITHQLFVRAALFMFGGIFLLGIFSIVRFGNLRAARMEVAAFFTRNIRQQVARMSTHPPRIDINLRPAAWRVIVAEREKAIQTNIHLAGPNSFVPAEIRVDGQVVQADVRLKGILADHWRDEKKWSLKVRVKNGVVFGMSDFSLMHPQTRGYMLEWLYTHAAKREGLIAPRFQFVQVYINGNRHGIYAMEEGMSRQLLEQNHRRIGPIVRFDQDLQMLEWTRSFARGEGLTTGNVGSFSVAAIDVSDGTAARTSEYIPQAVSLLEAFRSGDLSVEEVFDTDKLARFLALHAFFAASDLDPNDIKFFYNPITARLEPIVAELAIGQRVGPWWKNENDDRMTPFVRLFFDDENFFPQYIRSLRRIANQRYLEALFTDLGADAQKSLAILHRDYPDEILYKERLSQNTAFIQEGLNPIKGVHGYFSHTEPRGIVVDIANIQSFPVEILRLSHPSGSFDRNKKIILAPRPRKGPAVYQKILFTFPEEFSWSEGEVDQLRIVYRIVGTEVEQETVVTPWRRSDPTIIADAQERFQPNVDDFSFIVVDDKEREIFFQPGSWKIDHSLILPAGYMVVGTEGLSIDLFSGSSILSFSPFRFIGSADKPIVIQSSDRTGGGIAVFRAEGLSVFRHIRMRNLSAPSDRGWALTGAVTIYDSSIHISDSTFENFDAEDGLNVVNAPFFLEELMFSSMSSDAIDADFSSGQIQQVSLMDSGNDAIDISAGTVELSDIVIYRTGDKGISVGEASQVTIKNATIEQTDIAIASKDLSETTILNGILKKNRIGLAVYQKKDTFGSASLDAFDILFPNTERQVVVEKGSRLSLDGQEKKSNIDEFDVLKN